MAEHENAIGETSEWYTPPEILWAEAAISISIQRRPDGPLGAGEEDLHGEGRWAECSRGADSPS